MAMASDKDKRAFGNSKARNAFIDNMPVIITDKTSNDLYTKLLAEKRLERFKALVKVCSSRGNNIAQAVEMIKGSLPGYISNKGLTIETFVDMIRKHSDIAECWGYGLCGDDINKQLIRDKALELALSTKDMEVIKQYNEMYDKESSGIVEESKTENTGTSFSFTLNK